jgi:uncharacterized protein with GYD domain
MPKFLITAVYSSGSWSRMIGNPDDRTSAARSLAECLGGSLESLYWEAKSRSALAIADLPDPVTAAALATAVTKTGAFTSVESQQLLTQEQLGDVLIIAKHAADVYEVPGQSAVERGS